MHDILIGQSTIESLDFTESFGLLTTGLYVPFAMVLPFVILGVLIVNLLYAPGAIDVLSSIFAPVLTTLFGLPEAAIGALVMGFLRKDIAIGMLVPLNMSPEQLTISCIILATYFPCVATFVVLLRELGIWDMLKAAGLMIAISFAVGIIMRVILIGI